MTDYGERDGVNAVLALSFVGWLLLPPRWWWLLLVGVALFAVWLFWPRRPFAVFGNSWVHRLGHTFIALIVSLALLLYGLNVTQAWLIGCLVLPTFAELLDTYAGGFVVSWEQRKEIWRRARERGFTLSAGSIQDLWEYQLAWLAYPVALWIWG